jgi:hypothetical protein
MTTSVPDEKITAAIQRLGLLKVQRLQQELIEGLRDGEPRGYVVLRELLVKIAEPSQQTS